MLYSLFFCVNPDNSFKIYLLNITSSFAIAMKSEVFDINLVVKSIVIFAFFVKLSGVFYTAELQGFMAA